MSDMVEALDALVLSALQRRPGATVFILPRADGQYSNHATDTVALLEETGVVVDYATDPMATGVHAEKSADLILPPLLVIFSDAKALWSAISGVLYVIRWFSDHRSNHRVSIDVTLQQGSDGSSRRTVGIKGATADEAERLLRAAGRIRPPK